MDTTDRRVGAGARTAVRDAMIGRLVDGRYHIESFLARGGMATVYEATDVRLDRVVALKIMHGGLAEDDAFVSRFQREAKSAARLSHPHVVSVYDQGEDAGLVYLAMEYVPGRTVRDVLREFGRLAPEQALTILDPVLQALDAAHRAGFVHRDIKPENVLLGDDGSVKVADFGLARAISTSNSTTTQGVLIGTVAYLSPEQVERGIADARSDVYGAGILLYEMITGAVPYAGDTPLAIAYQHVNAAVPRPSSIRAGLPTSIDALVARATRHDPDERFAGAGAFLTAVRACRDQLPAPRALTLAGSDGASTLVVPLPTDEVVDVRSHPPGAADGISVTGRPAKAEPDKPPRRRRRRGGAVAALILLLVVALVGAAAWWLGSTRVVPVPGLVGKSMAQAQAALAGTGLTLQAGPSAFSETVPKGSIITTDPTPGGEASAGATIVATLSKGAERYPVPALAGKSVADATALLTGDSLTVGRTLKQYSNTVLAGRVITSNPLPGVRLKNGEPVDLVVSKGAAPVTLPKLVGRSGTSAAAALQALGLTSTTTKAYSTTVNSGQVISANPDVGTVVNRGSAVALVVSKGPPPVDVPSVLAQTKGAAIATLQALGLKVQVQTVFGGILGRVVRQSAVGPGALLVGDTITLTIT
ncbi:MAG: Stk1 family PASTA domain-containing Ser/Thr kinase [Candidatus Nanopelagicales bacterium]